MLTLIHAAAMKHVPIAEYKLMGMCKDKYSLGRNLINACLETEVERVVALSTDKAAAPVIYRCDKISVRNYSLQPLDSVRPLTEQEQEYVIRTNQE